MKMMYEEKVNNIKKEEIRLRLCRRHQKMKSDESMEGKLQAFLPS
jgi:hypothetical protein